MKRVAKHQRSAGLGRRHAGRAAKRCLRATAANLGFFDRLSDMAEAMPLSLNLFLLFPSALYASGRQALHKEPLAGNEYDHHRDQCQHRHGKHITPLSELMLPEKARDGNGQGAQIGIVDDRVGPRVLLPRGKKIEDADGCNGRALC